MDWLKKIDFAMTTDKGGLTFTFVLFAIILGFIISWILIFCNRKIVGTFVWTIANAGAKDVASAKTLAELGLEDNVSAVNLMKRGGGVSKIVTAVGAERDEKGRLQIDENTRFYVDESEMPRVARQYNEKGTNVPTLIIGIATMLLVGVLLFIFIAPIVDAMTK